ncbi:MAG: UDP-N-acetylmuramate dehydrogenase [Christensenellaceae bacterium]|jgi:UDP-N-acetylmuramate dehydrogenase|nr:UDP-N-acetylmuramate dehydrogenase [Christensenellaceae bacterium]
MQENIARLAAALGPSVRVHVPMAEHTSFRIGGPADLFFEPEDAPSLARALRLAKECGAPVFILGNGTNLLVSDRGIEGLVIHLGERFSGMRCEGNRVHALAGTLVSGLAAYAAAQGLMGLEWAAGIPGSVGGAVAMNAGAYGGEVAQSLERVEYLQHGEVAVCAPQAGDMGYRYSAFGAPERIVLSATFRLAPDDGGAAQRMRDYAARRKAKQPLASPSAGSAFKRPAGFFAGALIEQAGLKGFRVGGAQVSALHAGFIINTGGATSADVRGLIAEVQKRVFERSGVRLEPEVKFVGRE